MKQLIVALLLLPLMAVGQTASTVIIPSPLGMILTVGSWAVRDGEKVFKVKVVGYGKTEKDAIEDGFRVAIQQSVGEMILNQTTITDTDAKTKRINHSSGYIKDYDIIERDYANGRHQVTMNVVVKSSAIADKLTNDNLAKLPVVVRTANAQTATGDELIENVLADYPAKAFKVAIKNIAVERLSDRTNYLVVSYKMEWNKEFIKSIGEAINITKEDVSFIKRWDVYRIEAKESFFTSHTSYTTDTKRFEMFYHKLNDRVVRITARNSNNEVLLSTCVGSMLEPVKVVNAGIVMDGTFSSGEDIRVKVQSVDDFTNLELAIVSRNQCNLLMVKM